MQSYKEFINNRKSLAGSEGDVLEHNGGYIDIHTNPQYAPRKQSIIDFVVPEDRRNQGIGDTLIKKAIAKHNDLGGQVSSLASLKVLHNNGFRNPELSNGSFEDHVKEFHENGGSLFLAHKNSNGDKFI